MNGIYRSAEGARQVESRYREVLTRWPVPNRQWRVPTRQGETFVLACGPETAPPLLLFHGAGANSAAWMADAPEWSAHFRLYAVDLIGEAGLSAPSRPPLRSDSYALWLDDVLTGLALERVSLVGISLGGWLALDYATRRPDRVESLVLLCPGGIGRQKSGFLFAVAFLQLFGERGRNRALQFALGPLPKNLPARPQYTGDLFVLTQKHYYPRREKLPVLPDEALRRLTMPLLAILGGRDAILDSHDTRRRLENTVPHAQVCLFPEMGHLLPGQGQRILEFLTVRDVQASVPSATSVPTVTSVPSRHRRSERDRRSEP
jgi:pimeloyl-ACP methyl ester carboxylesterase